MIPRPPRATLTDTLFPYTTLFRSGFAQRIASPRSGVGMVAGKKDFCDRAIGLPGKTRVDGSQHLGRSLTPLPRSEEHTSELQSLMRISYAVFCLKKKTTTNK